MKTTGLPLMAWQSQIAFLELYSQEIGAAGFWS
jgi:hypothetical protein